MESIFPCLCILIKTWLILSYSTAFECNALVVSCNYSYTLCVRAWNWLTTVFPPSGRAHMLHWRQVSKVSFFNYSGREAPSLGFGSGSSWSRRTCQCMRARMRCASWVCVRILWASCYVISTQPRGFRQPLCKTPRRKFCVVWLF